MAKDLTKLGEDTEVGLDIDGDGKPDFKINLRAIGMVVVAIIYFFKINFVSRIKTCPKFN